MHWPFEQTCPHGQSVLSFVQEVALRGTHLPHPCWSQIGRSGGQLQLLVHGNVHWLSGFWTQLH